MKVGTEERKGHWSASYGYQERELMEAFQSLPVAQRRLVREVILTFARDAERERAKMPANNARLRGRAEPPTED